MQKHKSSKKFKTSLLKSIVALAIFVSPFTFAENPLVTQAKELQTGSEKVGMDHQKAIALLKKASDEGDAEAMYLLSQYYTERGNWHYLFVSQRKAEELLYASAMKGNTEAMSVFHTDYAMDQIHYKVSIKNSYMSSFMAKVKEGAKTDPKMMLVLAKILLEKGDENINKLERCHLFEKAYQQGYLEAAYGTVSCQKELKLNANQIHQAELDDQKNSDNYDKKILLLKEKSDSGDIRASIQLLNYESKLYDLGIDPKNIKKLKEKVQIFYEQQGKKGYADAYIHLANQENDDQKKQELLLKAIDLNSTVAMNQLALQWMFLEDDPKLSQKAEKLLERSVALGSANGMNQLAIWKYRQLTGEGDQQKLLQESTDLFKRAAEKGQLQAMDSLAALEDEPENYQWAVKAYENGSDDIDVLELAQVAFEKGLGASKNLKKAQEIKELNIIKKKIHKIQFPNS